MTDEQALDAAKQLFLDAEREILRLRSKIAITSCPLKIGEIVSVRDGDKRYKGRVDRVHFGTDPREMLGPVVGSPTGWVANGQRLKKDSEEVGKWTFAIDGLTSSLVAGEWVLTKMDLETALGLG